MRSFLRRATPLLLAGGALAIACARDTSGDAVRVSLSPTILFPRGTLDLATSLALDVYTQSDGVDCVAAAGTASGVTGSTSKVASQSLGTGACTGGAKFCGLLTITKSDATLVFSATATNAAGAPVANGCTTAIVNQDTLDVAIAMVRYVSPATCGNSVIEPTEQCDPPGPDAGTDPICDPQCHSKEIALSGGVPSPQGPASFLWPAQSGEQGRLFAFFTSNGPNLDVAMRLMDDALRPVTAPTAAATALLAPNNANVFPPVAIANDQSQPAAAFANNVYYYAFVDTSDGAPDIRLRSFDHQLNANEPEGSPIAINGVEANVQNQPTIAVGPGGKLFIAWDDVSGPNQGQVMGRTYDPSNGTLGTEEQISSGTSNANVRVAATTSGWIAVWDNGAQIKMRAISGNGTPSGGEIIVSDASHHGTQDHAGIAVLGDGRAAVVWADHGTAQGSDIFVQRYDANLAALANDQAKPINDLVGAGDQIAPAIAGSSSAAGGSFIAAWLDAKSGHVRARALDGNGGFLFNSVDGLSGEFQASLTPNVTRANPTVTIGGAAPWVAIGWDDGSTVYARRFPAPSQ